MITTKMKSEAEEGELLGSAMEEQPVQEEAWPPAVDVHKRRFPFCIVWSPIPVLTWLLPFIGHMGIANGAGVIYDFAGSFAINRDDFAFGAATRYVQCDVPKDKAKEWDEAVAKGSAEYENHSHNLICDNCHSHVAMCLNLMDYKGYRRWNMVILCFWMFILGRYTSIWGFLKSWVPFGILLAIIFGTHNL